MKISAKTVKDLRERTGAGMMDCKKALLQSNGDLEKAIDFLRKSGIAKAEKKGIHGKDILEEFKNNIKKHQKNTKKHQKPQKT